MKFCQCCGMPMGETDELYGTEKDGSKSADYCRYCYQDGDFVFNGTLSQMIDFCVKPTVEASPDMTEAQAREMLTAFLPTLKHWKTA